ncbi:hypothetical protein BOX15_Mlig024390g2 [Macrostomum lignano]|uniref:adenylate kinase n=1 Tax=Macrostomum lignano TaxID=282301 RepID=A0A267EAM4_9PLAT|nr:hypothetical protein BOX15_Mlig024390g2 [Macrostomum lignano]
MAAEPNKLKNANVLFVLGGPGSGKGTQCEKITATYGLTHLSTGDLLRAAATAGATERDKMLRAAMERGELVPLEVVLDLLRSAMLAAPPGSPGFLVDGYPRELDQAVRFEADLAPCRSVLFFNLDEAAMKLRLLKRGETSGRVDDNEATIVKRFQTFQKLTRPVVEHYEKQGKVVKIDASGSVDEVFQLLQKSLQKLGFKPVKNLK